MVEFCLMRQTAFSISPVEKIILAQIYSDGTVNRLENFFEIGSNRQSFIISKNKMNKILRMIRCAGFFNSELPLRAARGIDLDFHAISITYNGRVYVLQSSREVLERDNDVWVVTHEGIIFLEGRNREEVLKKCPGYFLQFRKLWSTTIEILDRELVPERK